MRKLVSARLAGNILLVSFGLLAVFHVLVLMGFVPANIIWGGQAGDSPGNLRTLEIVSLLFSVIFGIIIAVRLDYFLEGEFRRATKVGIWIIFAYLLLNTAGNLASGVSFENLVFAPITLVLAFFALRLAIERYTIR
jgi:hypothetical protein